MATLPTCDGECGRTIDVDADGGSVGAGDVAHWVACQSCGNRYCDRCVSLHEKRMTGHCDACGGTLEHANEASAREIVFGTTGAGGATQNIDMSSIREMMASGKLSIPGATSVPENEAVRRASSAATGATPSEPGTSADVADMPPSSRNRVLIVAAAVIVAVAIAAIVLALI